MKSRLLTAAAAATLALGVLAPSTAASAASSVTTFRNCAAIHHAYPGGIAKKGVKYNTIHYGGQTYHRTLVGKVKFSTALYTANKKSDADHDGIACEMSGGRRVD